MNNVRLSSCTFTIGAAAALLAGCGGSQPPLGAPGAMPQNTAAHGSKTFNYFGSEQHFKVPRGVTQLTVTARGASGPYGATGSYCTVIGGLGGVVKATIPVTPGETLAVFVGGEGTIGAVCGSQYGNGNGGFNGGGDGGRAGYNYYGDGGGGASDVRERGSALSDRVRAGRRWRRPRRQISGWRCGRRRRSPRRRGRQRRFWARRRRRRRRNAKAWRAPRQSRPVFWRVRSGASRPSRLARHGRQRRERRQVAVRLR